MSSFIINNKIAQQGKPVLRWLKTIQGFLDSNFCSTGLPLVGTRWVWSTFSSHSPLSSNQRCWLISATSIIVLGTLESNPGQLGTEASMLTIVLCCPLPILVSNWATILGPWWWSRSDSWSWRGGSIQAFRSVNISWETVVIHIA